MRQIINLSCFILTFLTLSSCVSSQKFKDMEMVKNRYQRQADSLRNSQADNNEMEASLIRLENEVKNCEQELKSTREHYASQVTYAEDLQVRFDELLEQNKMLLNASSNDIQTLSESKAACQVDLNRKTREAERLKAALAACESRPIPEPIVENCDEFRSQVNELNNLLQEKDQALLSLRNKVNQALTNFSSSDLSVSQRNGKIYVSLSQGLLFKTGSDQIDWKGKKAIQQLAGALNTSKDVNIMVEGHTDSSGSAAKNWDLSVRRATSVVKVLTGAGVDPKRVIAAGRSLYLPVASNSTSAGKAQNRRTEIILTPNLDELYKLINN